MAGTVEAWQAVEIGAQIRAINVAIEEAKLAWNNVPQFTLEPVQFYDTPLFAALNTLREKLRAQLVEMNK